MMHRAMGMSSSDLRTRNISAILLALLRYDGISRIHLARSVGLSTTTITNLVAELVSQGLVVEGGTLRDAERPSVGRPQVSLSLVPNARYAIGIHIEYSLIRVGLVNLLGEVVARRSLPFEPPIVLDDLLLEVVSMVESLISEGGISSAELVGLGVGASGLVDPYLGLNVTTPRLGWVNIPLQAYFAERLGLPVQVDNNIRAMALGEALFSPVDDEARILAFVYARTGVGSGLVMGDQLYRGAAAGAGEIGHTTILLKGGAACYCGNTGCLETLVSEPVLIEAAQALALTHPQSRLAQALNANSADLLQSIFEAARAGDLLALALLEERARYMGVALANLVNVINPDVIVLGGIFTPGEDLLLPIIQETVARRAFADLGERVLLKTTRFGTHIGMVGAAALALDAFFYRPPYGLSTELSLP